MRRVRHIVIVGTLVALAATASAQVPGPNDGVLQPIVDAFAGAADQWQSMIAQYALRLFWALFAIDLLWTGIQALLQQRGLQEFVADFVRQIFFFGFFLALLNYSGEWSNAIISSFFELGKQGVHIATSGVAVPYGGFQISGDLTPDDMAKHGLNLAFAIADHAPSGLTGLATAVFFGLGELAVVILFTIMALREVLILGEMYICLSAGTILLGFGGSRWTKDYAVNYYKYCVSVGVKLMFVQLTAAMAMSFMNSLILNIAGFNVKVILVLLLSLAVLTFLMVSIPTIAERFVQGVSHSSGMSAMTAMSATRMMTQAMQTGAAAMTAGGAAIVNAVKLAQAQQSAAGASTSTGGDRLSNMWRQAAGAGAGGGSGGSSKRLANGMGKPIGAALNLAKAASQNLGKAMLAGAVTSATSKQSFGGAVNDHLKQQRDQVAGKK